MTRTPAPILSSGGEYDVAANAISGGTVVQAGHVPAGTGSSAGVGTAALTSKLPLVLDIAGANPEVISIVVTSMSGTTNVVGAMNWRELR